MPELRKMHRLDTRRLMALLRDGVYIIDEITAEVRGPRGVVTPFSSADDDDRKYIRIYSSRGRPMRRVIRVAKLQWMARIGSAVPKGFEIHHRDGDPRNDAWDNLICLHRLDHRKMHESSGGDGAPF